MDAERQKLLDEIERLRSENAELNATVAELTRQVAKLTAALEEARRAGKRQAAPFRKKPKSQKPKKARA